MPDEKESDESLPYVVKEDKISQTSAYAGVASQENLEVKRKCLATFVYKLSKGRH